MTELATRQPPEAAANETLPVAAARGGGSILDYEITEADLDRAKRQLDLIRRFIRDVMVKGVHYGPPFPGAKTPSGEEAIMLLKPGAHFLCELYKLRQRPTVVNRVEEWDAKPAFFAYEIEMQLVHEPTGRVVGIGYGAANTRESKHRFRMGERKCPSCEKPAIRRGRQEWGGGWYCNQRLGGCGAKFESGDPDIEQQVVGRIENESTEDLQHTVLAIAKKRALKDAVESVTQSAGLLVADEDDDEDEGKDRGEHRRTEQPRQAKPAEKAADPDPAVGEPETKLILDACKKNGHSVADLHAWVHAQFGVDMKKARIRKSMFEPVMERVTKKEPLVVVKGEESGEGQGSLV